MKKNNLRWNSGSISDVWVFKLEFVICFLVFYSLK